MQSRAAEWQTPWEFHGLRSRSHSSAGTPMKRFRRSGCVLDQLPRGSTRNWTAGRSREICRSPAEEIPLDLWEGIPVGGRREGLCASSWAFWIGGAFSFSAQQICVYYISVDCFKQICGFCRHTQRKEIAQNLLGNMSFTDVKSQSDDMSFTEMLNDINELHHGDDSEEEDDIKMRQSSPPCKSIKIEKGSFVTKDPQNMFPRYGRTLQNNMAMLKRGGNISDTTTPPPAFSNNIYNFNNLSAATNTPIITPIIPTPALNNGKSALTSALSGSGFPSSFNTSSFTANALANAAISNTNNSAFMNNNNSAFTFNYPSNAYPNYFNSTPSAFTPSSTSISSFSSNAAPINPVTNINTIVPFNNSNFSNPIPINNTATPFTPSQFNPATIDIPLTTSTSFAPIQINTHKRTSSSRGSPIPSPSSSSIKPITHVTSTITPTPIINTSSTLASSTTTPITSPIMATPIINSAAPTPFVTSSSSSLSSSSSSIKAVSAITPVKSPTPSSPAMARTTTPTPTPTPPTKSGVTKFFGFGSFSKTGNYLGSIKGVSEQEFKVEPDSSLFDLGLTVPTDMQFYDDYLTLSSSPTSMFDPINTLAEVDKIYEQWEQERGGPRLFE